VVQVAASSTLTKPLWAAIAVLAAAYLTLFPAKAEISLADLAGDWQGSGTDRNLPIESPQQTSCQLTNRIEKNHMASDAVCKGKAGLNRRSRMTITLDGNDFTGVLDQTTTVNDDNASATTLKGTVAGRRAGDGATLQIRFPGFLPNATVVLKLISPSSYSVQGSALGVLMTDVTYNKIVRR
jgi:hypothetical protein